MKTKKLFVVAVALAVAAPALATQIQADFVAVLNGGAAVFGDNFDNGVLDSPPWFAVGTPGPESGTSLPMRGGDSITAGIQVNREFDVQGVAQLILDDFGAGSQATLILFGQAPGDQVSLTLIPGAAIFGDETGPLSVVAVPASNIPFLSILATPAGNLTATVDGVTVFDAPNIFSPASGISLTVVPEPATLGLLLIGATGLLIRRRVR